MENHNLDIDREREEHEYNNAQQKTWLNCRMEEHYYKKLELFNHPEITVVSIEPEFDYSHDQEWEILKKDASRAYKAKKEREHLLRNQQGI